MSQSMLIKKMILCLFLYFAIVDVAKADKAIVNIDFDLKNIAILEDSITLKKRISGAGIPFPEAEKEFERIGNYIHEQTKIGRKINISWHIINFELKETLFSNLIKGYHLFDITWFRLRIETAWKHKDGSWRRTSALSTGFEFEGTDSEATIVGYGDATVRNFQIVTFCTFGLNNCTNDEGKDHIGNFKETVDKEIIKENYRITVIKFPITQSVYLVLNEPDLLNKKIELFGSFNLGNTAIVAVRNPFYFPFDKYSFNFIYTSYYPAKINIDFKDIEDLDLSGSKKIKFIAEKNETKENSEIMLRKDIFNKLILNIILTLSPLIGLFLEDKKLIRWLAYFVATVAIYSFLPTAQNVPALNMLNLLIWSIFIILIIIIEIISSRKSKKQRRF